jgi:hypothetical protein
LSAKVEFPQSIHDTCANADYVNNDALGFSSVVHSSYSALMRQQVCMVSSPRHD